MDEKKKRKGKNEVENLKNRVKYYRIECKMNEKEAFKDMKERIKSVMK